MTHGTDALGLTSLSEKHAVRAESRCVNKAGKEGGGQLTVSVIDTFLFSNRNFHLVLLFKIFYFNVVVDLQKSTKIVQKVSICPMLNFSYY